MLSLADAGGRLLFSYKDLAELAGYTSRIYALLSTLHRVHADAYYPPKGQNVPVEWSLADIRGTVQEGYEGIRLEQVPIVAPAGTLHGTGDQLIDDIDMIVHEGEHTIISGPNGVGKTGVARVVAGLWPVFRGLVSKPKRSDIFYIPQRPYLSMGTLRDQIIYPDSHADMVGKDITDEDLVEILETVKLEYIPAREGGWETRKEWKDVFSGGEKQRIGMARMFYHRPRYAILDEATSAVSQDVEAVMYEKAKAAEISISRLSVPISDSSACYYLPQTDALEISSISTSTWHWQRWIWLGNASTELSSRADDDREGNFGIGRNDGTSRRMEGPSGRN
jgi:ATP-binding cassette subfamily D (ALD) long-chain fatty acid import protein